MAASSTKQMLPSKSLVALLLMTVLSCSCTLQAQARESKFFSKAIHILSTKKNAEEMKPPHIEIPVPPPEYVLVESPAPAPSVAPATAPVAAPVSAEGGYGLYGHGKEVHSPEKETEITTPTTVTGEYRSETALTGAANDNEKYKNEMMSEEIDDEESVDKEEYVNNNNNYYYNNKKENVYPNNYNLYSSTSNKNNEYSESSKATAATSDNRYYYPNNYKANERQGMSDTRFMENGKYYYDVNKIDNANERQGMSDTRYMENGKYYYDVNRVDDQNTYKKANEKESYTSESEGSYENESNQYEPNKSKYEFDTMEEYYKSQGYHLNNPEAYIP